MTTTANLVITFDETVDVESGDNDNIVGTSYNDVIFGDGSGGGGGGSKHRLAAGGNSGSGSDNIDGGAGNDIIFGDGFKGNDNHGTTNWEHGGIGGFGGGGGGGGSLVPTGMEVMVDYWPEVVVDNQTKSLELPYMEEFQVVLTASLLEESPMFLIINGEEIVQCLA